VIANDDFIEPALSQFLTAGSNIEPNVIHIDRERNTPLHDRIKHRIKYWHFWQILAFPNASNGLDEFRKIHLTPLDYFQQRIMSSDPRFKGMSEYLFYALSVVDRWRIQQTVAVIESLRTQMGSQNHEQILNQSGVENPHIIMGKIRGSSSYWRKYGSDMIAMIKQLGFPTFFFTFSYDDLNSSDSVNALWKGDKGGDECNYNYTNYTCVFPSLCSI
jgi:hypothetical protein